MLLLLLLNGRHATVTLMVVRKYKRQKLTTSNTAQSPFMARFIILVIDIKQFYSFPKLYCGPCQI